MSREKCEKMKSTIFRHIDIINKPQIDDKMYSSLDFLIGKNYV